MTEPLQQQSAPAIPATGTSPAPGATPKLAKPVSRGQVGCLIFGVVVLVIIFGAALSGSPPIPSEATEPKVQEDNVLPKIGAAELISVYDINELNGDASYKGKRYQITGQVGEIGKDILGSAYVTLTGGHEYRSVQCFLKNGVETEKAAGLRPGKTITVRGTIDGLMMNVVVTKCEIE